jgi:hypothetical protein
MKETLKEVAVSYFRILKQVTDQSVGNNEAMANAGMNKGLLPAALEGLAQIAHLVNVDTVIKGETREMEREMKGVYTCFKARD